LRQSRTRHTLINGPKSGVQFKHQFNPLADLKRNNYGVLEFSGNKPELEMMFDNYLRDREEDSNIIG
jgi:hypothetical protein